MPSNVTDSNLIERWMRALIAQNKTAPDNNAWSLITANVPGIPLTPVNGDTGVMADTNPHTIVPAQGVGLKFYCTLLVVSNTSATGTEVSITGLDSGNTIHIPAAATFGGAVVVFDPPLIFAANTAATATCSAGSNTFVSANGYVQ